MFIALYVVRFTCACFMALSGSYSRGVEPDVEELLFICEHGELLPHLKDGGLVDLRTVYMCAFFLFFFRRSFKRSEAEGVPFPGFDVLDVLGSQPACVSREFEG